MAETSQIAPTRARKASTSGNGRSNAPTHAEDEKLQEQIARLQEDLKAIATSIAGLAEEKVSDARSLAKRETRQFVRAGQHAVEEVTDEFGHMEKQIKDTIREKPLTAVAGAIALGFLLAVISR